MAELFVRRPVLAIVISILIVLLGLISLRGLAIKEYPDVAPPQVQIQAFYPGASAEVLEQTVAQPLEQAINGVDRMLYMTSTASNSGQLTIAVYFETGTDLDVATMLVQNRVAQAQSQLPQDVIRQGVTVKKAQTNILMLISLYAQNGSYDQTYLSNFITLHLRDRILRVPGVGDAQMLGVTDYSMRLWLKPDRMAQLGVDASDVVAAVQEQNVLAPAGSVGAPPQKNPADFQYTVQAGGRLMTPEQFGNVILRSGANGAQVHLRDVARIELGAVGYSVVTRMNDQPVGLLAVYQSPGADALTTARGVVAALNSAKRSFPPGIGYVIPYDTTPPITASIDEILITLGLAIALVVLVVYVFLQSWRATLIPLVTVPVALIGTFIFFPLLGFSINVLTMFGLVLAIGIVVDDAIVVTEAVMGHMERGMDRRAATIQAMRDVSGPVAAIALILCAVFVPMAFMGGITGQLYRQFALTIAIAVVLSAFNALTLSPALCSMLLLPRQETGGWLRRGFAAFNRGFAAVTAGYLRVAHLFVRRTAAAVAVLVVVAAVAWWLGSTLSGGFVPAEDKGVYIVNVQLPDAASLARTEAVISRIVGQLKQMPETRYVSSVAGFSILSGAPASDSGTIFVSLLPWSERKGAAHTVAAIVRRVNAMLYAVPGATAFAFSVPPISGISVAGGFTFELEDRSANTPARLQQVLQAFLAQARRRPELSNAFSSYSASVPQLRADVDRDQARQHGVPISSVYTTLQTFLGGVYVNDFTLFGHIYKVYAQADGPYRRDPGDISSFYVRGANNEMVPLTTLVRLVPVSGPNSLKHFNLYRAAEITGQPALGYGTGQALQALQQVAAKVLPSGFGYEWSGESLEEIRNAGQQAFVYGLAIVFVFLFLAALYESWSLPFSVLLGTPFAMAGALFGTWLLRLSDNVYTQIGIVLLIGLAAKNAILIVEFAKAEHDAGAAPDEAAMGAAKLRFRPILMTSFAFIFGTLPLVFATGSGANSRIALGTAVVFGMSVATGLGVFLIPSFYTMITRAGGSRAPASTAHPGEMTSTRSPEMPRGED
ncbi:MAG: efflux RND transporter permease subunit [Acetobacteraceae bacterium]